MLPKTKKLDTFFLLLDIFYLLGLSAFIDRLFCNNYTIVSEMMILEFILIF